MMIDENYVVRLSVREDIKTIAIPIDWLVVSKEGDMIKIRKATVMSRPRGCGRHHWYSAVLDMLPEPAAIKLENGVRRLKYATLYYDKSSTGYLVFERTEEGWLVADKEPEAFVYEIYYEITSRECRASYEIIRTENVFDAKTNSANCRANGKASIFLVLPTDREAFVEAKRVDGGYKGPCWRVVERMKISWNSGNPIVESSATFYTSFS